MDRKCCYIGKRKKRSRRTVRPLTTALILLRAKQLNLCLEELNLITVGDVIDMLTEQSNDHAEWDYEATQEDIDKFFG
jgi:hypothetical protein